MWMNDANAVILLLLLLLSGAFKLEGLVGY